MTVPTLDSTAAAEHFFAGAHNAGLCHVVLSPGSRSTPLTIAAARTPGLSYSIELDERVAAFVALGWAKASGQPVGLVCTSGTAAANYLPAVAEASMSNVPLVVITADRPPEHQRWGVGQSFDQRGLYHRHVRDELTMPVGGDAGEAFTQRAGWRATATAIEQHGPVHVNWAFRMPLEPTGEAIEPPAPLSPTTALSHAPEPNDVASLTALLAESERPLIIAGPDTCHRLDTAAQGAISEAAARIGAPILADVLSGLSSSSPAVVSGHALLPRTALIPTPDLIIHVGQTPTAKSLRLWWESVDCTHVLIDPRDEWQDPSHLATVRFRCAPDAIFNELDASGERAPWIDAWSQLGSRVDDAVRQVLNDWPSVTEAHIAHSLGAAANGQDQVVASSSMPVRDLDTFSRSEASILANRGINGIDGVASTAVGVHHASVDGRTFVLIGDVAALHDIGGILAAARNGVDLTIVIPNNDGGGIFSFLPIKDALDDQRFDELFHTPHGTTFDFLSEHANVHYALTSDVGATIASTADYSGVVIIEVAVNTADRLALQDAIHESVEALR